mmetsp:Transcript_5627/g.13653  ORF Transcript_5627/g.13653 Transcript_5627/m.13653 type:complete len:390 (-) Transcript_5627:1197-2366(-)
MQLLLSSEQPPRHALGARHLTLCHHGVEACLAHQIRVRPLLDDFAVFDDADEVRVLDRREPVRDHHDGAALHEAVECRLHHPFALRVQLGRGLVENEDRRVLENRARNRDPLPLPRGQPHLGDDGLEALWELVDELRGVCLARCRLHLGVGGVGASVPHVLRHCPVEQHRLLRHEGHVAAVPLEVEVLDILAVQHHRALLNVIEALDEARDRRLAVTRAADQRGHRAWGELDREFVENNSVRARRVREDHVPQLQHARHRGGLVADAARDLRLTTHHTQHSRRGYQSALLLVEKVHRVAQRFPDLPRILHELHHILHGRLSLRDQRAPIPHATGINQTVQRVEPQVCQACKHAVLALDDQRLVHRLGVAECLHVLGAEALHRTRVREHL